MDAKARSRADTPTSTAPPSSSSSISSASDDGDSDDDGLSNPSSGSLSSPSHEYHTLHSEFGHCSNPEYRRTSAHTPGSVFNAGEEQDPPYYILISVYITFLFLICIGHTRDFFGKRLRSGNYKHLMASGGYAALNSDFDSFYTRRLKQRIEDLFARPVTGVPGRTITLLDRVFSRGYHTNTLTGTHTRALNISSYNYLGFAQGSGGCADAVEEGIRQYGISTCGARLEGGSVDLHTRVEALVASFVGMEDALISSMGFATNSTIIPALVSKNSLVISDELNHASIRVGVRFSGASVRTFKHNDMASLEALLREVISQGQPRTHRPWSKILVIVEGLYSMEGTLVNLPGIMKLKNKYKFYLFVDEAHSIGALGPHGRGVADYFAVPPRSIDILMGTFTKSFGAAGGYVAGSKALIDRLRVRGHSGCYAEAMSPPVMTQVVASMASIMGVRDSDASSTSTSVDVNAMQRHPGPAPQHLLPSWLDLPPYLKDGSEGRERLRRLAFNARYLSLGLRRLGFITYGHIDSPIIPLLLFNLGKMPAFSRMMLARNTPIVVVVVAYPATSLTTARVRFCVSASHTKEDVDCLLRACDEVGGVLDLKHAEGERWSVEEVVRRAGELVNGGGDR
ncbi:serine palmitoyltransferase 2 [Rickenella mellea]|uniref:serine C-palmitoyltransferase n=1 Tax=Rickenella mellea TaxID=50990 RepID=A0A4Y7Q0G2_9AGAM|nr:serine palmitoyltransferase 2 [Rickenella mellea]